MAPLSANERRQLVKLLDRIRIEGTQRVAGGDVGIHDGPLQTPDGDIPPTGRAVSNRSAASVASAGWGKRSSTCNRTNALCRFKESDYARPHTIGWLLKPLRRRPRTHTQTFSRHCSYSASPCPAQSRPASKLSLPKARPVDRLKESAHER